MMQLAHATPPAPLATAIDDYLATSCGGLDRAVVVAELPAVKVRDPERAARTIDQLCETLAGLAIGTVIGAVAAGVRRGFGPELGARVTSAIGRAAEGLTRQAPARVFALDDAPVRSFADEVKRRVRRRIALAPGHARPMLDAAAQEITTREASELRAFVRMLALTAEDPVLAERYAAQLAAGWRCARAVIEGSPPAMDLDGAWPQWLRRARGLRAEAPAPLTSAQLAEHGFVMRIG